MNRREMCILLMVMCMKTRKALLSSLLKTAQMGQVGIRSVLDTGMQPELRKALRAQLREYDTIEAEAHALAASRGWELKELDPAARLMADMTARLRLRAGDPDSRIADMVITGSTRGMVKGLKRLHRLSRPDEPLEILSQKLLDCEHAGIQQMQPYL